MQCIPVLNPSSDFTSTDSSEEEDGNGSGQEDAGVKKKTLAEVSTAF